VGAMGIAALALVHQRVDDGVRLWSVGGFGISASRREATLSWRRALKVTTLLARRYYNRELTQQSAEGAETPEPVAS
jgi:hypothetical protein